VEHHAPNRDLGLEGLQQVPGDRLAFAVTVRGEVELVGLFERVLQLGNRGLLVRGHQVQRFEVVVDVDTEPGPRLALVLRRHIGSAPRQVADVPPGGLHHVAGPEERSDLARFRG